MMEIPIQNSNKKFMIADEDYARLCPRVYYLSGIRKTQVKTFQGTSIIKLTELIFGNILSYDHKDRNPFNFQKSNLRVTNQSLNMANRDKFGKNPSSRYKGVSWCKRDKCWRSHIRINGKNTSLGTFDDEWKAAVAYNQAAVLYFHEFAVINKKESVLQS